MKHNAQLPNVSTGSILEAQVVTDKRGFAARWQLSPRTISNFLAQGMPHCRCGERRVRIVVCEGDAWMKERFGTRRLGPANSKLEAV
jgi:hypothetical protein